MFRLKNDLVVGRDKTLGFLAIESGKKPLNIINSNFKDMYTQHAFDFDGKKYVVIYNTAENVPSGRKLIRGTEENDVYEIEQRGTEVSLNLVTQLPLGIDVTILTAPAAKGMAVCGQTACVHLSEAGPKPIQMPAGQLVELASDDQALFGLFQKEYDDYKDSPPPADVSIFSVCRLSPTEAPTCTDVEASEIPYKLTVTSGSAGYKLAKSNSDLDDLLRYDLSRIRDGLANLFEPNLEARIAWGNVYYINGLTTLVLGKAGSTFLSEKTLKDLKARLGVEIDALRHRVAESYPGLLVKRYSVNREPLSFLLHIARTARTIARASEAVGAGIADEALKPLLGELRSASQTLEYVSEKNGQFELRYRKGAPFWADGSNVPWNYQSAWIEALGYTGLLSDPRLKTIATSMIEQFKASEKLSELPAKWNYVAGDMQSGWDEGSSLSSNTPAWAGQKSMTQTAHVSYRVMDAMALLAADKAGIPLEPRLKEHFADLVVKGYLYPFALESMDRKVAIPRSIARHYARAIVPWNLQNQVWALDALATR